MIVELGGITFDDEATMGWGLIALTDWYTIPDSKATDDPIPQADGSFDPGADYRSSAAISFTARYVGLTHAEALAAVEQFNTLGTSRAPQPMTVTDDLRSTSRQVSVRHAAVTDSGFSTFFDIAVDCLAWDPLRYGAPVSASTGLPVLSGGIAFPIMFPIDFGTSGNPGRIVLPNEGTQASWPRFTVTGALGGFSLACVETGQEIRFEFPLSVSDAVTVDSKTGRAWINAESNSVSGYLTGSEWFPIPPGGSRTIQFNAIGTVTGSPTLTGTVAPAWL